MTKNASFKKKVRARMAETGERYATARMKLLAQRAGLSVDGALPGYAFHRGEHSDLARLTQALAQWKTTSPSTMAFDEATVFALSGGVGFMYFVFEYDGHPPMMTFTCRSWSMPGPLVARVLQHAGVEASVSQTGSAKVAQKALDAALDDEQVAHVTVDLASMPYAGADPMWKGQWPRQVNVVGREGDRYLIDDGGPLWLDKDVLADARAACRKEKNRLVVASSSSSTVTADEAARAALGFCAENYVTSPVKGFAGNFGLKGLAKFADALQNPKGKKSWAKVFSTSELAFVGLLRLFECANMEYTSPMGGRAQFAAALRSMTTSTSLDNDGLAQAAALSDQSAALFAQLGDDAVALGGDAVERAVALSEDIAEVRASGRDDAGDVVLDLRAAQKGLAAELQLSDDARVDGFAALGAHVAGIVDVETQLVEVLTSLTT